MAFVLLVCTGPVRGEAERDEAESPSAAPTVAVEISGVEDPLLTNVRRFLGIAALEPGFLDALVASDDESVTIADIRRLHRAAPGEIRQALMPYGYYLPSIDAELSNTGNEYTAHYQVDPGERAHLGEVTVQVLGPGADTPAVREALAGVDFESGAPLDHAAYEAAKTALYEAAYGNGYLDAQWQASAIRVAPDRLKADIALVLQTGPRFYFGRTRIEQDILAPDFMSGFVHIEEGAPYDVNQLIELQRTLNETDYFSRVEVRAPREAADAGKRIPVTVIAEPAKPQRYTMGLGYGTDTGPRVKLGVLQRRLNQRGHRLRADLQLSSIEQAIGARYEIPIRNYQRDVLAFFVTARKEEIGDAETEQISLGASHLVDWFGFRRRLYIQADREQFSFGDGPTRETDLVYPGVTLSRERADDPQFPRRGYSVRADLRAGFEDALSDVSFSRIETSVSWVRGIAPRMRLLLRGEAGILWTDRFVDLPPSQRFFAGGDRSIRGYPYREVGPQNAAGDTIGGKRLLSGSVEIDRLIYGNFGAAVFADAGDAFDDTPDIKVGAGVGLRWRSPIGMVRFDVAHPFDGPDDVRIHLTIGAEL